MGKGQSWGGSFGVAEEVVYDTAVTPSSYLPVTTESIKPTRPNSPTGGIYTTRVNKELLPTIIEATGGFTMETNSSDIALPMKWWNGQSSVANVVTPTGLGGTPAAGGTLTDGNYRYQVANVLQRTASGLYFLSNVATETGIVTTGGGNNTINLTWTNVTPPTGFTHVATVIYRTPGLTGASGTEQKLFVKSGTGNTHADATDGTLVSTILPPATVFEHTFVPAAPVASTHPLDSFTLTKLMDNDFSEQYSGCRMNTMTLSVGDQGAASETTFDAMCRRFDLVANPSPSYDDIPIIMNWMGFLNLDNVKVVEFEGMDLAATNNLASVPGLCQQQFHREFYPGKRDVSGSINIGFENHDQFTRMTNATSFELFLSIGIDSTTDAAIINQANSDGFLTSPLDLIRAWPFAAEYHMPKCLYQEAGGNLSGGDRMVESLPFLTKLDPSLGYELKVTLFNKIASL